MTIKQALAQVMFVVENTGAPVSVFVADDKTHRTVEVESREFEYQAKRFLESV